jgi:hypothetical protein
MTLRTNFFTSPEKRKSYHSRRLWNRDRRWFDSLFFSWESKGVVIKKNKSARKLLQKQSAAKTVSESAQNGGCDAHHSATQFQSKDSNVNLTRESLRQRNRMKSVYKSLYWQLVVVGLLLVSLASIPLARCNDAYGGHQVPAPLSSIANANASVLLLPDESQSLSLLPDQDCFFPYFKQYTGACVAHRYIYGQSFYYHVPKFTTGYVVLIHGAGVGRSEDWFVRINRIPMMKKFIDNGFAVCAVQSVAQWTMLTRQRDLRNQDGAFWEIVRETGMDPNVPVFAVCVSRGCQYQGWMAETFDLQRRPIKAQYMSIPWGVTRQFLARSSDRMPPTIVAIGGEDNVAMVNTAAEMSPWIDAIRARGVEANLFINRKRNVDQCFHSLCKFPQTGGLGMTRELVREMQSQGVIDASGSIIIPLPAMQGVENPYERLIVDAYMGVNYLRDWPIFSFDGPMIDWIYQELSELQGGHRHTSDFDPAVVNMFLRQSTYGQINSLARN